MRIVIVMLIVGVLVGCAATDPRENPVKSTIEGTTMRLGNFSVSLAVRDLAASRAFYEKLGFRVIGGEQAGNWLILQNETSTIGLFQGMFDKNMLTFNPGWDRTCNTLADFDDVRDIQQKLKTMGITPVVAADETSTGPASLMVADPDGNPILLDQHVERPAQ
jgi:catechol 2,3-dioxygenase-like lactoylglutathione lyase family enzyme